MLEGVATVAVTTKFDTEVFVRTERGFDSTVCLAALLGHVVELRLEWSVEETRTSATFNILVTAGIIASGEVDGKDRVGVASGSAARSGRDSRRRRERSRRH